MDDRADRGVALMPKLEEVLASLDEHQRRVAEWEPADGNLRIVAPAGSGKTTTLIALNSKLLLSGAIHAEGTILTTFANKAAKVLTQRLGGLVPMHLVPERIGTFHALALRRLRKPGRFPPPLHRWDMAQCMDVDGRTRNGNVPPSHILWRCATEFGRMPGTDKPSLKIASSAEEVQQYARFADLCRSRMCDNAQDYVNAVGGKIKPPPDFDEAWAMVREAKTA